jgi:hypothetical protein
VYQTPPYLSGATAIQVVLNLEPPTANGDVGFNLALDSCDAHPGGSLCRERAATEPARYGLSAVRVCKPYSVQPQDGSRVRRPLSSHAIYGGQWQRWIVKGLLGSSVSLINRRLHKGLNGYAASAL